MSGSPKDFAICMSNKIIWHIGKAEKSERGQGILPIYHYFAKKSDELRDKL